MANPASRISFAVCHFGDRLSPSLTTRNGEIVKLLLSFVTIAALVGCGGPLKLLEDGKVHIGKFDAVGKTISVSVNGVQYTGSYVLNSSSSYGSMFVGAKYIPMNSYTAGNMGRAILTSPDGKVIRCEFMAQSMSAQGSCSDNSGKMYDLIAG